jgi:hypothetical protein
MPRGAMVSTLNSAHPGLKQRAALDGPSGHELPANLTVNLTLADKLLSTVSLRRGVGS